MKTALCYLLISCTIATSAQDISPDQAVYYASLLVKKQVLTERGKNLLLQQLKSGHIAVEYPSTVSDTIYSKTEQSKQAILVFLRSAFGSDLLHRQFDKRNKIESKIKPEDKLITATVYSTMILGMGGYEYQDCIHPRRSTIGSTRTRTLQDIYDIGIINDKIYEESLKALTWELVSNEYELMDYLLKRSVYYKYYDFNRMEQEKYIQQLAASGILQPGSIPDILKQYTSYKLLSISEILEYSPRYGFADLSTVTSNPSITYPIVFNKIKTLFPAFNFSNLQVALIETAEGELTRQDLELSFKIEGRTYTQRFYHNYRKSNYNPADDHLPGAKVNNDFHKGINQWLLDINSEYRLHIIRYFNEETNQFTTDKIGFMLLKQDEVKQISKDAMIISHEVY